MESVDMVVRIPYDKTLAMFIQDENNKDIDMIVEVPYNTNIKYEYDKNTNKIRCDRILSTSMVYPGNYGYFPNTLSGDNNPLDVLLITNYPLYPGSIISVKIIGVLITKDESGQDEKIIAVPANKVDPNFININDISDIDINYIEKVKQFFKHYKDNETGKWVEVGEIMGSNEGFKIYQDSKIRYQMRSRI